MVKSLWKVELAWCRKLEVDDSVEMMFVERGKGRALESRFLNLRSRSGSGLLNQENFSIAEIGKHLS
jgi:hypothetical protein